MGYYTICGVDPYKDSLKLMSSEDSVRLFSTGLIDLSFLAL